MHRRNIVILCIVTLYAVAILLTACSQPEVEVPAVPLRFSPSIDSEGYFITQVKPRLPMRSDDEIPPWRHGKKLFATPSKGYLIAEEVEQLYQRIVVPSLDQNRSILVGKPVIYLYPTETTEVSVKLDFKGTLEVTYPEYNNGWAVTAYPDGRLINHRDNREYSYLFWEGISDTVFNLNHGFVVKGSDTATFLQEKLAYMGLTPREYNEFIVYWLPLMQGNAYNLISFQEEAYTESAILKITPEPDSILRVFMTFKPLDEAIDISEQVLQPFERRGFTVIEWGAAEIK